ncbi:MAG: phosphomannose isomerase type II C-terminal cupin domain [Candidatus Omnitrophica bacterium]|nr:phosphomannose isomerase type II C-terminal cupin domain [Candidatus Omnitrophota bacterium]
MSIVQKPWGNYQILHRETGIQVKRIELRPGLRFSLQKHLKRSEKWVIIQGSGTATVGGKTVSIEPGSVLAVACGQKHRMHNTGQTPLVFIEVQFGDYLGEDDVVRFEDDFGRVS